MRANAPIAAILALAALSLSSAPLEARSQKPAARPHKTDTATHKAAAHSSHKAKVQAETPTKKHPKAKVAPKAQSKAQPKPKHHARHHHQETVEDTVPPTITRIKAHQKATSTDFLQAAGATPSPATTITAPQHPEDPAPQHPENPAPQQAVKSPAKPISVVSAIRPSAERPSLPSVQEAAATPVILPSLYNKRGRLIVPPPLKGSHEILLRQNQVADRDGLDRIRDDEDILELRDQRLLVVLPTSETLVVDERLPANRRYCRPWTAQFLVTLSHAYYERFHTPLQVNSAVRTVEFQQRLLRTNGNAAPAEGDTASPHLTGQAVDLAKHGLSLTQIAWLRGYLLPLVQQGKVDVEEEFQQACFHISVYKKYLPPANAPRRNLASSHPSETSTLATAVQ
jgi:hypothetical protein